MRGDQFGQLIEYVTDGGIFNVPPDIHALDSETVLASVAADYVKVAGLGRTLQLDASTVTALKTKAAEILHADVVESEITGDPAETFSQLAWVMSWPLWVDIPVGASIEADSYVRHDARLWQVKQTHNKLANWPPLVPVSLFWPWYDPSEPVAWKQPVSDYDAYPLGYRVRHRGVIYRSLIAANVWEPGAQDSEALWIDESPPPPVGVWAAGVSYKIGDLVTYLGLRYRVIQAHVSQAGWTPAAVPALFQLVP